MKVRTNIRLNRPFAKANEKTLDLFPFLVNKLPRNWIADRSFLKWTIQDFLSFYEQLKSDLDKSFALTLKIFFIYLSKTWDRRRVLLKDSKDVQIFFVIERQSEYYKNFITNAVNLLKALEESIHTPLSKRESRNEELTKKYFRFNKVIPLHKIVEEMSSSGRLANLGVVYTEGEGFSYVAIKFAMNMARKFSPQFKNINLESEIIFEVASHPTVPVDEMTAHQLKVAVDAVQKAISKKMTFSQIYESLQGEHFIITILTLKWLGNIAEMDEYPREKSNARNFLLYYVRRMLNENKDILDGFSDFVFQKIEAARRLSGSPESVGVALMLTGAENLGTWLRKRAEVLEKDIEIKGLLLTGSMTKKLHNITNASIGNLPVDSKRLLVDYLQKEKILEKHTQHIVFIDTGFMGSINKTLKPLLEEFKISNDYLLISHSNVPASERGFAEGLNEQEVWSGYGDRIQRFSQIIDDGFDATVTSPVRIDKNGNPIEVLPTPRPWFNKMIEKQIEDLASDSSMSYKGLDSYQAKYGGIDFNANNLNLKEQGQLVETNFINSPDTKFYKVSSATAVIDKVFSIKNFQTLLGTVNE